MYVYVLVPLVYLFCCFFFLLIVEKEGLTWKVLLVLVPTIFRVEEQLKFPSIETTFLRSLSTMTWQDHSFSFHVLHQPPFEWCTCRWYLIKAVLFLLLFFFKFIYLFFLFETFFICPFTRKFYWILLETIQVRKINLHNQFNTSSIRKNDGSLVAAVNCFGFTKIKNLVRISRGTLFVFRLVRVLFFKFFFLFFFCFFQEKN